jgi:hypothetical protein
MQTDDKDRGALSILVIAATYVWERISEINLREEAEDRFIWRWSANGKCWRYLAYHRDPQSPPPPFGGGPSRCRMHRGTDDRFRQVGAARWHNMLYHAVGDASPFLHQARQSSTMVCTSLHEANSQLYLLAIL